MKTFSEKRQKVIRLTRFGLAWIVLLGLGMPAWANLNIAKGGKAKCVIDGELMPLDPETVIRIHKKALRVLMPGSVALDEPARSRPDAATASR